MVAVALAIALTGAARADLTTVYVDFGTRAGSASGLRDGNPATWNVLADGLLPPPASKNDLVDSTGADTGIDITGMTEFDMVRGRAWTAAPPAYPNWCVDAAVSDGYKDDDYATSTVTFADLELGQLYNFEIASTDEGAGADQQWKLVGGGDTGWQDYDGHTDAHSDHKTLSLDMWPNAQGEIELQLKGLGRFSYLAATKIEYEIEEIPVPEPAGLGLLGLAMLATRKRRRR
ncbi:MAG: PEP-CTERM sorting domain-containing protein [Planctomycetota bacterium]